MYAIDAAELVNRTCFMPYWRINADRKLFANGNQIDVTIDWLAPNFNEENAPYYPAMTVPGRRFTVDVHGLSEDEVLRKVLDLIIQCQTHESREAFRVLRDGRWVAPFHPHRTEGQELFGDVAGDVAFENAV